MGFLRKVGKKIKKGIKKLFSSKLGSIVGMVGLYFAMGAIAKGLTGTFGQAATTTAETAATTAGEAAATTAGDAVATAASNTEAAANAINTIENAANSGELVNASTSITDVVSNTDKTLFSSDPNTITGLKGKVDTSSIVAEKAYPSTLGGKFSKGVDTIAQGFRDLPTTLAEAPGKAYEYVTGPDFLPDVAKGAATSFVTSEIMGEPEEPFISGGVMPQPTMEAAQGAYVSEVSNQLPQFQGTNFQQLNQSLFYGTLSPQFLMGQMG
jgi:hypothetical protein